MVLERRKKEMDAAILAIQKIWEAYPELRLGQIIANVLDPSGAVDYYYYEDDEIAHIFTEWLAKQRGGG